MINSMLAATCLTQAAANPITKLEAFLVKHPSFTTEFTLTETGRVPAQGKLVKSGEKSWQLSVKGPGVSASLTRIGESLVEVDHLERRYEEFDEFTTGRAGSSMAPYFPVCLTLDQVRRWKAIKPQSVTANATTVVERNVTTTLTLNADGSPQFVVSKVQMQQEQTVLTFKFSKFSFDRVTPPTLHPPIGFQPWVDEIRWPMPVGDPMLDVLGRGDKAVSWKTICEGSRVLLVFVQEGDKLSDALRADIEKVRGEITGARTRIIYCFVGKPLNMDKEPLWLEPDGRACRALGLMGTPVMSLVAADRMIEWTWQGYGPKQRLKAMASLKSALKGSK